jgi:phage shock protein PspC (stress-responsive transcriptional regulator)
MNKIITINLGGIAIDIEEDAYEMLRSYLLKVKNHFKGTENGAEIVEDIEARIAEMLFEKLKDKKVSINTSDVESVVTVMGQPSDFEENDESEQYYVPNTGQQKRLFRDPDGAILGGVCSGLAKFFNIEVTIMRIIWLVLFFVFGTGFIIYIILWAIIPKANTAAEKLQMTGEVPNIENIKNTIRDEANQAYTTLKKKANSAEVKALRNDLENFLMKLFRFVFKIAGVILFVVIVIGLLAGLFHFFMGDMGSNWAGQIDVSQQLKLAAGNSGLFWFFKIALLLLFVIPMLYILLRLATFLLNLPKPNSLVRKYFWATWSLAFLTSIGAFIYGMSMFREKGVSRTEISLDSLGDTIEIKTKRSPIDDAIYSAYVEFDIEPTDGAAYLMVEKTSRGSSIASATNNAAEIKSDIDVHANGLTFGEKLYGTETENKRLPSLKYTLYLPQNKVVILHSNTSSVLHHIDNLQNIYDRDMAGKSYRMDKEGLNCLDPVNQINASSDNENYNQISLEDFDEIEISDAFYIELIDDNRTMIEMPKNSDWTKHVRYRVAGSKLKIDLKNELEMLFEWEENNMADPIIIHSKNLKRIEGNGASKITYRPSNNQKDLYVDLNGAAIFKASSLALDNLQIEASGASRVELSGSVSLLELEIAGACNVEAAELKADYLRLDVGGASRCNVHVIKEISGDVSGASKIRYKGSPNITADMNGLVSISKM